MKQYFLEEDLRKQFKTHSIIAGILLLIMGLISILLPELTSLAISFFIGWMLIIGSLISSYHVMKSYNSKWIAWFKPFILFAIGSLILYRPMTGVAAIGLILMIYFLFDGFAGLLFGLELRPLKGWIWMLFNGLISILIAFIFLVSWPISSLLIIGLLVGISLIIDGAVMIIIGSSVHRNIF